MRYFLWSTDAKDGCRGNNDDEDSVKRLVIGYPEQIAYRAELLTELAAELVGDIRLDHEMITATKIIAEELLSICQDVQQQQEQGDNAE